MAGQYADHAVMVLCAADVDQIWHYATDEGKQPEQNPSLPSSANIATQGIAYIHDGNFEVLGQLRCDDLFICKTDDVYYGLALRATSPVGPVLPGDLLIAVRGTMDGLEWLNDSIALTMAPGRPSMRGYVGQGFWQIYTSMHVADLGGAPLALTGNTAAAQLVELADQHGCPNIFVCGHSLGAALATYLAYDLGEALGANAGRLRPYFFASPKTGTTDWVNYYQSCVPRYDLANYALDFVPMVPPDGDTLNAGGVTHNVHVIAALSPGCLDNGVLAKWDASENHSPIGYARMLDGANAAAQRLYTRWQTVQAAKG